DEPVANLSAVLVDFEPGEKTIVTRGWIDPKNKDSLSEDVNLATNQSYTFSWEMETREYEFKEGHQIGLVILSSDHEYTKRPEAGTEVTVYPEESHVTLPLTGQFPEEDLATEDAETSKDEPSNTFTFYVLLVGSIVVLCIVLGLVYFKKRRQN